MGCNREKRGTKSLGRSRENWREHHIIDLLILILSQSRTSILSDSYCSQVPLTFKHVFNYKSLLLQKLCKLFQLYFVEMVTLLHYHFTLRGHSFTLVNIDDTCVCLSVSACVCLCVCRCVFPSQAIPRKLLKTSSSNLARCLPPDMIMHHVLMTFIQGNRS